MSVVENMNLPPTLLSRFDLIYLILDQPNPVADRRLAKHIVALYYEHPPQSKDTVCLLYTSPSPRDATLSRMPSSA